MVIPRSSSVPLERLDRLADEEESDLEFMDPSKIQTHRQKHVSSELDTDQREGIINKLNFAARHLNDRKELCT